MGELLALRWRDVDFAGSVIRVRSAGRAVSSPLRSQARWIGADGPDVASALARVGDREHWDR